MDHAITSVVSSRWYRRGRSAWCTSAFCSSPHQVPGHLHAVLHDEDARHARVLACTWAKHERRASASEWTARAPTGHSPTQCMGHTHCGSIRSSAFDTTAFARSTLWPPTRQDNRLLLAQCCSAGTRRSPTHGHPHLLQGYNSRCWSVHGNALGSRDGICQSQGRSAIRATTAGVQEAPLVPRAGAQMDDDPPPQQLHLNQQRRDIRNPLLGDVVSQLKDKVGQAGCMAIWPWLRCL